MKNQNQIKWTLTQAESIEYIRGILKTADGIKRTRLEDRDNWIGWDSDLRQKHRHQIVNMSRFLVRSNISCKNLASLLLGMVAARLPEDFEKRYSYRPLLLESFVDTSQYAGTCYKAANWQHVGRTKGRGRQDRYTKRAKTIKDIYLYPLRKDFRTQMDISMESKVEAIEITSGIDSKNWAENEFGTAPLGDSRLTKRLIQAAADKAEKPGLSYSGAVGGDGSKVKGYYRMIDQPDDSAVTMENILLPHRERTIQRMKGQEIALCIQDGSDLNYSSLDHREGLGVIGANQTNAESRGLRPHSTLAVTTEGVPLGIIRAERTAPTIRTKETKAQRAALSIEQKKNFCWIKSVRDCEELKTDMPDTTLVNVLDREGDFFEMFDDQRCKKSSGECHQIELLVRAKHDRKTTEDATLFDLVRQSPVQAELKLEVPGKSGRSQKSKQKARPKHQARTANVSIHYRKVQLNPPSTKGGRGKAPVSLWVIRVRERFPPQDAPPLEWVLLTTIKIKSVDDAINCVKWYCSPWRIEDWHRVLKSGCKIEETARKTAERLKRSLAINMVIAWRIMLMTLLGRETPDLPAEVMFTDIELEVLTAYTKKKT